VLVSCCTIRHIKATAALQVGGDDDRAAAKRPTSAPRTTTTNLIKDCRHRWNAATAPASQLNERPDGRPAGCRQWPRTTIGATAAAKSAAAADVR